MSLWARQGMTGIVLGIVVFAALFIPVLAWQYRRFGRLSWPRFLGAAACSLFGAALVAYTLLPMPVTTAQWCAEHAIRHAELRPGNSIQDALRHTEGMSIGEALRSTYVLQIVFNVVLFVPLGVILRRYLGRSVLVATVIGFAVSLLIEATQYTAVWGLLECAYRLADVDDVIMNTLGALIGALVAPAVLWWMPTARRLQAGRHEPREVTGARRLTGMLIDIGAFVGVGVLAVLVEAVAATWSGDPMPTGRTPGHEWLLTMGIPTLVVVVLPALTPSGASLGQRAVWLRPRVRGRLGALRRLTRIAAAALPVIAVRSLGVLGVGWSASIWTLATFALVLLIASFVVVDRSHRGLSGWLAGIEYVDARAPDPAGNDASSGRPGAALAPNG